MTTVEAGQVILALAQYKNVLLEGPPGTGKTRVVADVLRTLEASSSSPGGGRPLLRVDDPKNPLTTAAGAASTPVQLPSPLVRDWVTFHQSYTYEDFILGKRPVTSASGLRIEPQFGVLMGLVLQLDLSEASAALLVIDEVNRANASQVFGEFITLLDPEYRRTIRGKPNSNAVTPHLPGLRFANGLSEPVALLHSAGAVRVSDRWTFPEHVYVLATMNSVDKAALPLDSALTRRFHRIAMQPSLHLLATGLGLTWPDLEAIATAVRTHAKPADALSAEAVTVLLLERINHIIAGDIGEDFELGHGLMWEVVRAKKAHRWEALATAWDNAVLPQVAERFAGRADALRTLLRAGEHGGSDGVRQRRLLGSPTDADAPVAMPRLSGAPVKEVQAILRALAV